MSYAAIEVELHGGRVVPRGPEPLPQEGAGLLVILSTHAATTRGWQPALADIRKRQLARGHAPRSADAVARQIQTERESWH